MGLKEDQEVKMLRVKMLSFLKHINKIYSPVLVLGPKQLFYIFPFFLSEYKILA